jgi:hypothetical protein
VRLVTGMLTPEARGDLELWACWMAGPIAWFAHMVAVYALADWACQGRGLLSLHLATAAGFLVAALGGRGCWARRRRVPRESADPREVRERFMATQGLLAALLFSSIILVQWITVFVLDPCPL